jgi:hypothetical protein
MRRELDRVAQQVSGDLLQPIGISPIGMMFRSCSSCSRMFLASADGCTVSAAVRIMLPRSTLRKSSRSLPAIIRCTSRMSEISCYGAGRVVEERKRRRRKQPARDKRGQDRCKERRGEIAGEAHAGYGCEVKDVRNRSGPDDRREHVAHTRRKRNGQHRQAKRKEVGTASHTFQHVRDYRPPMIRNRPRSCTSSTVIGEDPLPRRCTRTPTTAARRRLFRRSRAPWRDRRSRNTSCPRRSPALPR